MYERIKDTTWNSTYKENEFLTDINSVKNRLWNKIVNSNNEDDRYYQEFTLVDTLIPWQQEYTLETITENKEWVKNIKDVSISYWDEVYKNTGLPIYKNATKVNYQTLSHEWNWYLEHQDKNNPIYYLSDNSIFIAPMPLEEKWSILMRAIRNIPDYTFETWIKVIPYDLHSVLEEWVKVYSLQRKRADTWEINNQIVIYNNAEAEALDSMKREEVAGVMKYPEQINREDRYKNSDFYNLDI